MNRFISRAPTRTDLAGGTLDIWPLYCVLNGAYTVNVAVDLWEDAHFSYTGASSFSVRLESGKDSFQTGELLSAEAAMQATPSLRFPLRLVLAYLSGLERLPAIDLHLRLETQVPRGSGLGGSSALAVAILRGLWEVTGRKAAPGWENELLRWVQDFEAQFLEVPTGTQDYLAAIHGGLRCYSFHFGSPGVKNYPTGRLAQLADRLLVLFSGDHHQSGLSNWEIYRGVLEDQPGYRQGLNELKSVSVQVHEQLLGTTDWAVLGKLLNEEWNIRHRVFRVNTPRLDEIISFLRSQAILGVKVCGAAQGGSLVVVCEPHHRDLIAKSCAEKKIQVLPARPVAQGVTIVPT